MLRHIHTAEELAAVKEEARALSGLVIHFKASWCEPCASVSQVMAELAQQEASLIVAEVAVEENESLCEAENVDRVPYVLFYRSSGDAMEPVAHVAGAKLGLVRFNAESLFGCPRSNFASLNDYLKHLTSKQGIFIFITGTPSQPRCGFTDKLCQLLEELKAPYHYYDVMADNEVCEALKVYSEWPTYPQVYMDGELLGGLDVCQQLHSTGELKKLLKLE